MVINIGLLIQGIIIYVLFIVGISIISEWLVPKKQSNIERFENNLDNILEIYKNDIKKSYMDKVRYSYGNIGNQMGHREYFTNDNQYSQYTTEEDFIMKQVSSKLIDSTNCNTIGQEPLIQNQLSLSNPSNNYRIIPRKMDFHEPERMSTYSEHSIDNYTFNTPFIKSKKQVQFNDCPEDKRYSPENYRVNSIEHYDINYKLF